jgi:hypothetical protein
MATDITWLEPIADNWDPSTQQAQWVDILPPVTVPASKTWHMTRGNTWTASQMLAAGCTHVTKFDISGLPDAQRNAIINAGKAYNDPMGNLTAQQYNLPDRGAGVWRPPGAEWPNIFNDQFFDYVPGQTEPLTPQQGTEKGNLQSTAYNIVIWENAEQNHAISDHWSFVRAYFEAFIPRMVAKWGANNFRVANNYFSGIGGSIDNMGRTNAKLWMRKSPSLWNSDRPSGSLGYPSGQMLPGGTLELTNLSCFAWYVGQPDTVFKKFFNLIFAAGLNHKAGKFLVSFVQGISEWRPNNFYKYVYPEGLLYKKDRVPVNPNYVYSIAIVSFIWADGLIAYLFDTRRGDKNVVRKYSEGALWFPTGASTPQSLDQFPHFVEEGAGYYTTFTGIADVTAMGVHNYVQSWVPTEGGTRYFCDFRLDGGSWVTAQNAELDDVVDAHLDERGICAVRILGGLMSVFYMDPFANNTSKILEFKHPTNPTITYTQTVSTCIAHVCLINI